MSNVAATLTAWSYGLAALGYLAFAVRLLQLRYLRRPLDPSRAWLFTAMFFTAVWAGMIWMGQSFRQSNLYLASELADVVRYAAWALFLLVLLRDDGGQKLPKGLAWLGQLAGLLVLYVVVARLFFLFQVDLLGDPKRLVLYGAMALPVLTLVLIEQLFANVTDDSRWNVKPLCLGLAGAALFDLYLFSQAVLFNRLDEDAMRIRGAVHALMLPLLVLASMRRANWLTKIQLSRKAAFHSATLVIAGLYLLFVSGVGYYVRYFGGEWGSSLQIGLFFAATLTLIVLALSGSVRAKLRVFLGKHFFRYRYDYREEWLRFTRTLSSQNLTASGEPSGALQGQQAGQQMGQKVVRGLADLLESPGGGLWLRGRGEPAFTQIAFWNLGRTDIKEEADSPLCQFMMTSGWVVNLEEFRASPRRYGGMTIPPWLSAIEQAWLIVPLVVGEEMIGFVVLARARTRVDVNWEVNDLLKTAGRQAASFLAQMQATEALLEVRKFDAFNRMSAFVVHDLKNIVTQLSLMMKNAQKHSQNPEFQRDMLMTVENSLDRMRQLMLQLREGATPPGTNVGVDLVEIVRRIEKIAQSRGRHLEFELEDYVGTRGQAERLERIIGHVVQNAFDATPNSGQVKLTLSRRASQACIEVTDTGVGMTREFIRTRLFKPFQTTKQAGMGIGAYESFQYVQELGGKIEVDSELNRGTRVTMLLPLFEIRTESDLQALEA